MTTKQLVATVLCVAFICGLIPTASEADNTAVGDLNSQTDNTEIYPETSGYCGSDLGNGDVQDLTWRFEDGTLTFSGIGDNVKGWHEVDTSLIPWYPLRNSIRTLIIEEGVRSIGAYSFLNLYQLQKVVIPDSLKEIGYSAFRNCWNLKDIVLPSVERVSDGAFSNCSSLESVSFGSDMRWISAGAFAGCIRLKEISIPDTVIGLGDDEGISSDVFYGCSALETIEIGNGIELRDDFLNDWENRFIGYMFGGGDYYQPTTFFSGRYLKRFEIGEENPYLRSINGVLFDVSGETLIRYPRGKQEKHYKIRGQSQAAPALSFRKAAENH